VRYISFLFSSIANPGFVSCNEVGFVLCFVKLPLSASVKKLNSSVSVPGGKICAKITEYNGVNIMGFFHQAKGQSSLPVRSQQEMRSLFS
jgi:hypothetical protein